MNSKTLSPELVKELETLVNSNIDMSLFPYVKGKSIRIKHIIIRETNFGFLVFDTKTNKEIDKMFCKTSAVALAKTLATDPESNTNEIMKLDYEVMKNFNDAMFHRHMMKVTKDSIKYDVAQCRYDIAYCRTQSAKERLDQYIY
ncbi:hypothetical protein PQZ46_00040 [bacterium]|jgi:hypothetical protein|nr:hypothetical protein [bacterium]